MSGDDTTSGARRGYSARILLRTAPECAQEELDDQYEKLRHALQDHEDEIDPPLTVRLTREAPDSLGAPELQRALSTCREAMIDVLGVAADDPGVTWHYAQRDAAGEAIAVEVIPD